METRILPVRLTDAELLERGQEVAKLLSEIALVEEEKKAANSGFKARVEELEGQCRDFDTQIRNEAEQREVSVSRSIDDVRGVEEVYRDDTGEVIGTRALSPSEIAERKQGKLALLPDAKAEPEA